MEEDNQNEAKKPVKKKEKESDKELENEVLRIRDKIAALEEQSRQYEIYKNRDILDKMRVPLADKSSYPNEEEQSILEDKVELHKDFTLPDTPKSDNFFKRIFKKNEIKKDGTVAVMLLHPTTDATLHYIETEKDGSFKIEEETYHVNEHCLYSLKHKKERYPLCLLPTWSMIPIGTQAWFELSQERRGHELERMIIQSIKKEEIVKEDGQKKKSKISGKTLWLIIGIVVLGYFLLKSGAIKF